MKETCRPPSRNNAILATSVTASVSATVIQIPRGPSHAVNSHNIASNSSQLRMSATSIDASAASMAVR